MEKVPIFFSLRPFPVLPKVCSFWRFLGPQKSFASCIPKKCVPFGKKGTCTYFPKPPFPKPPCTPFGWGTFYCFASYIHFLLFWRLISEIFFEHSNCCLLFVVIMPSKKDVKDANWVIIMLWKIPIQDYSLISFEIKLWFMIRLLSPLVIKLNHVLGNCQRSIDDSDNNT